MKIKIITPPTREPISLEEARLYLGPEAAADMAKADYASSPGFPKWAPARAVLLMNELKADLARQRDADNNPWRDCPVMLHRLLTYEGMRTVWDALRLSKKLFTVSVFASTAACGFRGPLDEASLTPGQHRAYLKKVQKLSGELSKILRGTDLDFRLVLDLDLCRQDAGHLYWNRFSQILDSVASGAIYLAKASAGKRTHGEDARRAYFVRELTRFFREYLGGPRRKLVAIATATAFDDPSFDVRQVYRLAP